MAHLADQINHLDSVSLNRYSAETVIIGIDVPDGRPVQLGAPYSFDLRLDTDRTEWVDDVLKWPSVDYGCIYTYFILNTPDMYTAEALKSFRSHDSYAPYLAAHVQTVVYHACM